MIEDAIQLVDGMRPERVTHFRPVERDPHDAVRPALTGVPVIGDVGEIAESGDGCPLGGIEGGRCR